MQHELLPCVSIIMPTHNRCPLLRRTLDSLACQSVLASSFEVIVVADGCADDTGAMLRAYQAPYTLRVVEQEAQGAAMARNAGAAIARAPLLLFLDDDVEATPGLVAAHLDAHAAVPGRAVLGPYPPAPVVKRDFFLMSMRHWWNAKFTELAHPGHRFTYEDLLTGNLSLDRALFERLGGLDPAFKKSGEDYEFGLRLLKAGVQMVYEQRALAYHHNHDTTNFDGALRRAYNEGRTDILLAQRHPEIGATLPFAAWYTRSQLRRRVRGMFIFHMRGVGDARAHLMRRHLNVLELLGLRARWGYEYNRLRLYWYWRGVADHTGGRPAMADVIWEVLGYKQPAVAPYTVDVGGGLAAAEARLDADRPASARVCYSRGGRCHDLGLIPAVPGAEPLRGPHLRRYLLEKAAPKLLRAMALEGGIADLPGEGRDELVAAIERTTPWFGPTALHTMWYEQYIQFAVMDARIAHCPEPAPQVELVPLAAPQEVHAI